jgi:hypothetical protein
LQGPPETGTCLAMHDAVLLLPPSCIIHSLQHVKLTPGRGLLLAGGSACVGARLSTMHACAVVATQLRQSLYKVSLIPQMVTGHTCNYTLCDPPSQTDVTLCARLSVLAAGCPTGSMMQRQMTLLQGLASGAQRRLIIIIIIIPCKPYLSASATAPHPLGRRKVERLFSLFSV